MVLVGSLLMGSLLGACAGEEGFAADEAETLCRIRFDEAESSGLNCQDRASYLDTCEACFMDCRDCTAEFNICPPLITFCE